MEAAEGRESLMKPFAQASCRMSSHAPSELLTAGWSNAGEEEKRKAHEALEKQEAELARYAQQVAADQQQAAALQAKIKAMEEKVPNDSLEVFSCICPPSLLLCPPWGGRMFSEGTDCTLALRAQHS